MFYTLSGRCVCVFMKATWDTKCFAATRRSSSYQQEISLVHFMPNIIGTRHKPSRLPMTWIHSEVEKQVFRTTCAELELIASTCSFQTVLVRRQTCKTTGHHTVAEGRGKFYPISVWDHCWIRQEFTRKEIWLANQKKHTLNEENL